MASTSMNVQNEDKSQSWFNWGAKMLARGDWHYAVAPVSAVNNPPIDMENPATARQFQFDPLCADHGGLNETIRFAWHDNQAVTLSQ